MSPAASPPAALPAGLLELLVSSGSDLLAETDADGRVQWANQSFTQCTGLLPDASAGLLALVTADEPDGSSKRMIQRALDGTPLDDTPLTLQSIDGESLWVRATVRTDGVRRLWLMRDCTAQVRAERAAAQQAELLDMAQKFGRIGVWEREIASGQGRWDVHTFRIFGIDPADGTPDFEGARALVHPEDRHLFGGHVLSQAPGRNTVRYRLLRADGSVRWLQAQWEVKQDGPGRPLRAIGIIWDDTDAETAALARAEMGTQLRLIEELGNVITWRHDVRTQRIHFSDRALDTLRRRRGPDREWPDVLATIVHPEDRPRVEAAHDQALRTGEVVAVQARYRDGNDQWRLLRTRRVLQRAHDGTPLAVVVVALDVSEQAELTSRFEAAAVAAGLGLWSRDPASGQAVWNAAMYALCGRDPALGPPSMDEWVQHYVHPQDRQGMLDARQRINASPDQLTEFECRIVRPDGQVRWLVNRGRNELHEGRLLVGGVTLDVTESRLAERALRHADQRSALAARAVGIGTWEMRLSTGELFWDEQMFLLFGLPASDRPPERSLREALLHPDDRVRVPALHDAAIHSLDPASFEFRTRQPDDSYRWLASRSMVVRDEDGRPEWRVGVNWDITEARSADHIEQQRELAERANQAKSQFLSRMSHELRTPLNAMLGFTQLLELEVGQTPVEQQRQRLAQVRLAGTHLLSMIDDMLDLSGLDAGRQRFDLHTLPLHPHVADAVLAVQPLAVQCGVRLSVGTCTGHVLADAEQLHKALVRVLSLALKHSPAQSEVCIESEPDTRVVVLRIRETGQDLSAAHLSRLFSPSNPLGLGVSGAEGGSIGLVVVKALVEGMGGALRISGNEGAALIEIELPAGEPPVAAGAASPPDAIAANQPGGRILYIEDNPVNVLLFEELVRTQPRLDLRSAETGSQGVEAAQRERPDLILVDMQLPDFDGFEVLRRLRAEPATAGITCVALSANAMPQDIERALASGFADYWTKPIDFKRIVTALERYFPTGPGAPG